MAPKQSFTESNSQRKRLMTTFHTRYTAMRDLLPQIYKTVHERFLKPTLISAVIPKQEGSRSHINEPPHSDYLLSFFIAAAGHTPTLLTFYAFKKQIRPLYWYTKSYHPFDSRSLRKNYQPLHNFPLLSTESLFIPLLAFYLPVLLYVPPRIRSMWNVQLLFTFLVGILFRYILMYHECWEGLFALFLTATPFIASLKIHEEEKIETGIMDSKSQWQCMKGVLAQMSSLEIWGIATGVLLIAVGGLLFCFDVVYRAILL